MKLFFWGFLLIFLDFSLTINGVGFDLMPDAIGYLLVFLGTRQMAEESEQFARMRPIALVLMIVGFVSLLLSPFGPIELTPRLAGILAATTVPCCCFCWISACSGCSCAACRIWSSITAATSVRAPYAWRCSCRS